MKNNKKIIGINNYCKTSHIINEYKKSKGASFYAKVQGSLFYQNNCLENKRAFVKDYIIN